MVLQLQKSYVVKNRSLLISLFFSHGYDSISKHVLEYSPRELNRNVLAQLILSFYSKKISAFAWLRINVYANQSKPTNSPKIVLGGPYTKVSVRNVRRDIVEATRKLQKDKEISEDEKRDAENRIQNITDEHVKEIDRMLSQKEIDIKKV